MSLSRGSSLVVVVCVAAGHGFRPPTNAVLDDRPATSSHERLSFVVGWDMKGSHGRRSSDSVIQGVLNANKHGDGGGLTNFKKSKSRQATKPSKALLKVMRRYGLAESSRQGKPKKSGSGFEPGSKLMQKIREGSKRFVAAQKAVLETESTAAPSAPRRPAIKMRAGAVTIRWPGGTATRRR